MDLQTWIYTEYGATPMLCKIHMDTDMDMDTEYGSTWSVETLYIP